MRHPVKVISNIFEIRNIFYMKFNENFSINNFEFLYTDDGEIEALEGHTVPLYLYGYGLTNGTQVVFTSAQGNSSISVCHETPCKRIFTSIPIL